MPASPRKRLWGRVVSIRSEKEKDIIKHFTKDQLYIYERWRNREAKEMNQDTFKKEMDGLEEMFAAMCGR